MRSYAVARGLFSFLNFVGWIVVGVGVIAAFVGGGSGADSSVFGRGAGPELAVVLAMPGLIFALCGLIGVAFVQMARAGVDMADDSQISLQLQIQQLEAIKGQASAGTPSFSSSGTVTGNDLPASAALGAASFKQQSVDDDTCESQPQSEPEPAPASPDCRQASHDRRAVPRRPNSPALFSSKHESVQIEHFPEGVFVGEAHFENAESAREYIDAQIAEERRPRIEAED